jgi:hypothetical protein
MPPLNQIEITIPGHAELKLEAGDETDGSSDASVSSEISLDAIAKYQSEERRRTSAGNSSWNPDELDYSLSVLLPSSTCSAEEGPKESLLGSDYSLDVKLSTKPPAPPSNAINDSSSASRSPVSVSASVSVPVSPEPRKPSKVRFYSRVRIQRVTNRKNLDKQQVQDVWYSRDEFKAIRKECFHTIKCMKQNQVLEEEDGYCVRGLEYKTPDAYKERQHNKAEIRTVVFEEQDYQFENGMSDPTWIAKLSEDQSSTCVKLAIAVALQDAEVAKEYLSPY